MKVGREALIDSAVALIEEQGGVQGVNMRAVAARASCAHTNVYNYFESYEALLWAALGEALRRSNQFAAERVAATGAQGMDEYLCILLSQLDFAESHPGLYRFIFFEYRFSTPMPTDIVELLGRMRGHLRVLAQTDSGMDPDEFWRVHEIVFRYLCGEACALLQGRFPGGEGKETVRRNVLMLCEQLMGYRRKQEG